MKTKEVGSGKLFTALRDTRVIEGDRKTPVFLGWKAT